MRHARRAAATLALALCSALAACGEASEPAVGPPPSPRAVLALEPPTLTIGEAGVIELLVVTPPEHGMRPFEPPDRVEGLWLLGSEGPDVEKQSARWVYRTRLRIHARELGTSAWPAGQVEVVTPDGDALGVPFDALPVEVVSVLPEYPDQLTPFGARAPEPAPSATGSLVSAAAGALTTLVALGAVALVRRRIRARASGGPDAPPPEPPWVRARADLAAASAQVESDPLAAADLAARTLCRYMARRFGADAEARTSEEIAQATPPFAATSRWPRFVALLRELDETRFPHQESVAPEPIAALLSEIRDFVEETVPDESLQ